MYSGVLIAVDKKLNISIANSEEMISEDKYQKCVNFDCYLCRTGAKKWGIVNILGKDILEIDEIE
ncbi:hypothetical protein BDAP_001541 [Binucleata daphniae]